jgi:hypothetical protein
LDSTCLNVSFTTLLCSYATHTILYDTQSMRHDHVSGITRVVAACLTRPCVNERKVVVVGGAAGDLVAEEVVKVMRDEQKAREAAVCMCVPIEDFEEPEQRGNKP